MANRIVNTSWRAFGTKVLPLGERGENDVTQIVCDVSAPLEQYPYAAFSLIASNANGEEYPVQKAVLEGNSLIWTVTKADTAYAGSGWVQAVMFGAEGEIAKTPKNATLVNESLDAGGEPPKPVDDWLEEAQKALSSIPSTIGKALAEAEESGKFDGFSPVVELRRVDGGVAITVINKNSEYTEIVYDGAGGNVDPYTGTYEVTPLVDAETTLPTAQKFMDEDVRVKAIPYFETTNTSDGETVFIGTEVDIYGD